jgi:phosphoserine aminotransferase
MNLSAGCAALPVEVLLRAQREFVEFRGNDGEPRGLSVAEMGYRTSDFYEMVDTAEEKFRELMSIPDTHEVHFFNGGATLQFAAIPMNLLGKPGKYATQDISGGVYKTANYVRSGHWSEKARDEARMYCHVHEVCPDPTDLYFEVPDGDEWDIDPRGAYLHYTAADTRQGFEFQEFPYEVVPEGMTLCCDASANFGSKPVDISKYGVIYAAGHKNFTTSGVCYTIIRKDLISEEVLPGTPTMCNWQRFQTAPGKVWTVPVVFAIWLGLLQTEWMLERGGLPYFEELAIRRSNLLYDMIDGSGGFYNCFVTQERFRSRMQVVFTIGDGEGANADLVAKFLHETEVEKGWLDVKSHPLGVSSDAIRVTMYNPQTIESVEVVRDFMIDFMKRHA